jgi:hypothetical protein
LIETDAPSVKVRETAERETPARSATSFNVTDHAVPSSLMPRSAKRAD